MSSQLPVGWKKKSCICAVILHLYVFKVYYKAHSGYQKWLDSFSTLEHQQVKQDIVEYFGRIAQFSVKTSSCSECVRKTFPLHISSFMNTGVLECEGISVCSFYIGFVCASGPRSLS